MNYILFSFVNDNNLLLNYVYIPQFAFRQMTDCVNSFVKFKSTLFWFK
jgi:hypothetical protein